MRNITKLGAKTLSGFRTASAPEIYVRSFSMASATRRSGLQNIMRVNPLTPHQNSRFLSTKPDPQNEVDITPNPAAQELPEPQTLTTTTAEPTPVIPTAEEEKDLSTSVEALEESLQRYIGSFANATAALPAMAIAMRLIAGIRKGGNYLKLFAEIKELPLKLLMLDAWLMLKRRSVASLLPAEIAKLFGLEGLYAATFTATIETIVSSGALRLDMSEAYQRFVMINGPLFPFVATEDKLLEINQDTFLGKLGEWKEKNDLSSLLLFKICQERIVAKKMMAEAIGEIVIDEERIKEHIIGLEKLMKKLQITIESSTQEMRDDAIRTLVEEDIHKTAIDEEGIRKFIIDNKELIGGIILKTEFSDQEIENELYAIFKTRQDIFKKNKTAQVLALIGRNATFALGIFTAKDLAKVFVENNIDFFGEIGFDTANPIVAVETLAIIARVLCAVSTTPFDNALSQFSSGEKTFKDFYKKGLGSLFSFRGGTARTVFVFCAFCTIVYGEETGKMLDDILKDIPLLTSILEKLNTAIIRHQEYKIGTMLSEEEADLGLEIVNTLKVANKLDQKDIKQDLGKALSEAIKVGSTIEEKLNTAIIEHPEHKTDQMLSEEVSLKIESVVENKLIKQEQIDSHEPQTIVLINPEIPTPTKSQITDADLQVEFERIYSKFIKKCLKDDAEIIHCETILRELMDKIEDKERETPTPTPRSPSTEIKPPTPSPEI